MNAGAGRRGTPERRRPANAWEMTLADLTALLLCFFVLLQAGHARPAPTEAGPDASTDTGLAIRTVPARLGAPDHERLAASAPFSATLARENLRGEPQIEITYSGGAIRIRLDEPRGAAEDIRHLLRKVGTLYRWAEVVLQVGADAPPRSLFGILRDHERTFRSYRADVHVTRGTGGPRFTEIRLHGP